MLKAGVDLRGLSPQMSLAYTIIARVYSRLGQECVITSCSDGKHGLFSLHYKGKAMDFRTWGFNEKGKQVLAEKVKEALGYQFDVVLEGTHLHVEFDPKDPEKLLEE